MPKISVITAVKNGADYLPETIDSVIAQTFTDWEYIIVDDNSDDGKTPDLLKSYAEKDNRIRVIHRNESGGPYVAANQGIKEATGNYIARTDGDDIMFPERLQKQYDYMQAHPDIKCVACFCQWMDDNGPIEGSYLESPTEPEELKWQLAIRNNLIHSSSFFEKAAFEKIGLYNEKFLSQDYRMFTDFAITEELAAIPEVLVYFRKHNNRVTVTKKQLQQDLAREVMYDYWQKIAPDTFSEEDINLLYNVAFCFNADVNAGIKTMQRVKKLAKQNIKDASIKQRVIDLINMRTNKFLRTHLRKQPVATAINYLKYNL